MELNDPDILKYNILQLLIRYPNGVKFGDFSGAFYQIHHFHPQFSHYGYSSLRGLLGDMKETVVIECSKSSEPVMKLINDLNLDGLLDEIEQNGPDSFEQEDSRLKEEEKRAKGEDKAAADLAEVLAAVTNLLLGYGSGLQFEKMQTLLFSTIGIDLQTFSITKGYKDVLTFLGDHIPNLIIRHRGNKYVVQLAQDLTVASVPICSILKLYPDGLKLSKLKEEVKKKCGYDLEVFCYQVGFSDIVSCLQEIPELVISRNKNRNCRIQLKSASLSCSSSQTSHSPSSDSKKSTCISKSVNQDASEKKPASYQSSSSSSSDSDQSIYTSNSSNKVESEKRQKIVLSNVMASITALLSRYMSGLRVKKLQDLLLTEEGIDLEKFSFSLGHKDSLEFLEQKLPQLILSYRANRLNSVVIEPHSVPLLESTGTADPLNSAPDVPIPFLKSIGPVDPLNSAPVPLNCTLYHSGYSSSPDSYQSSCPSNYSKQDESEKGPVLSDVMALVTDLLSNYKKGLRIWKLQDFLLTNEGLDIEKFSIAQGYKDTVEFLEQKMPQLTLKYQVIRLNTVVIVPHSDLEEISEPASAISELFANGSQYQNASASVAVVPPEVNNLFHTNQSGPSTMSSNLPSFHEPHNTLSVKAKSSSLFSSVVQSQQPNPRQPSAKSVTKQTAGNSQVATFQPSTVQDELKQQVALILARHPNGMSLFQFRIAYSATFKQHFPVGNAASTKQRLLEMPDIVYLKGHGVQALLMPVSPDVSPAKPGQPVSSKVENVAVVSSLELVHPVPGTEPSVQSFDSHSVWTSPLDSPENPGSKDCCISKDLSPSMLLATCQEQEKARTSLPGFSDQLSKIEDIPVPSGCSLPTDESLIVPQSLLVPAAPRASMIPIPRPHHSFLQYYQSIRALENKGNKPFTELHTQSIPGSIKIMQTNTSHLNGLGAKLREIPFIPDCSAALPTHSQCTVCGENLQPGILKSRFTPSTNSNISVSSVDSPSVPPVLVKPSEIYSPRSTSQSFDSIQPMLPVQPPPPSRNTEQRDYNCAVAEFDSFSEIQIQSRASQHFSSPDSSAKMNSVSSLSRNSASCFPSRSQPDHQLQQPTHTRPDDLQSISVSLADKASLDSMSPAAIYQRKPTYANSIETNSTTESFIACSVSGAFHTSSVIANNSRASSSVSSRRRAVNPASSPLDFTANSYDQIAYDSAKSTSNSSPLFSETQVSAQQREYARTSATVISNTETTSPTSLSPESTTSSHHQFAYASSRITTNSSALSSETYAFTHQSQNTQASETRIASSTKKADSFSPPLDSTTSLPCHHAYASSEATSTSSVLSKSIARHTPNADFQTNLNHDPPSQNNLTSSLSKQGDQSASLQKKQVPVKPISKHYNGCLIL
ncbi:mucin-2-like isoform X1 [Pantherophis guttatus]|uniref:Mucin-2-like isoform X1 n=1 Tax=Pantherophis guttatus TaxID=94885 RepID=A0A6P9C404_PANGU|nr:mucin-2-like isoform X1 [Pantherophis guttatus]XP_060549635.1 mucin-2-like isoform X1 [Pantherophis guttatus]